MTTRKKSCWQSSERATYSRGSWKIMARKTSQSRPLNNAALLLLFIVTGACVSCGGGARGVPVVERGSAVSPASADNTADPKVQLGAFQELAGSDYLMAPIATPDRKS